MDFELTEEQEQIKALIRQFCKREVDLKRMRELSEKANAAKNVEELRALQPWDLVEKLHEVGLRQLCVPTKYGGGGVTRGGFVTRATAAEEAGYWMEIAVRLLVIPWNHCAAIAAGATEEHQDWFFPQFMENHTMFTAGSASEPQGATDIHLPYDEPGVAMKTFAYKDGNEWVINGDKMFSSAGGVADLILVGARIDKEAPYTQARRSFWVPKDASGLTQVVNRLIISEISGNIQNHFDNVRVSESHMIKEVSQASVPKAYFAAKMLHFATLLGHAQSLYDQIRDYAKERVQGGRSIIEHPNIAAMLGEAAINLEATRAYIYRAAWENDQRELAGEPVDLFWSLGAFYQTKKMCLRLCEIASEVYAGIGGSVDMPLEWFVRRVFCFIPTGSTANMNAIKYSMLYNDHPIG